MLKVSVTSKELFQCRYIAAKEPYILAAKKHIFREVNSLNFLNRHFELIPNTIRSIPKFFVVLAIISSQLPARLLQNLWLWLQLNMEYGFCRYLNSLACYLNFELFPVF